jgi:hypothetical protein
VQSLAVWALTGSDWGVGLVVTLAVLAYSLAATFRLVQHLGMAAPILSSRKPVGVPGSVVLQRAFEWIRLALLFAVGVTSLSLVFDGRYRPLDWGWVAGPAALAVAMAFLGERTATDDHRTRLLAWVIAGSAPLIVWLEGWTNLQALALAFGLAALSAATLWPGKADPGRVGGATDLAGGGAASAHVLVDPILVDPMAAPPTDRRRPASASTASNSAGAASGVE